MSINMQNCIYCIFLFQIPISFVPCNKYNVFCYTSNFSDFNNKHLQLFYKTDFGENENPYQNNLTTIKNTNITMDTISTTAKA